MASQRHKLLEQGSTAAGEIHAQGAVAPGIAMQVDPSELNVLMPKEGGAPAVEAPIGEYGGPLKGSSLTGAVPVDAPFPIGEAPRLTSIYPAEAPIQSGDVTMTITGVGFTAATVLIWNGTDDTATYVSDTELTTVVKTDLATMPIACMVEVRNGDLTSNALKFQFLDAEEPAAEGGRAFPIGPSNIGLITDHENGLEIGLIDALDVQVGDTVQIEATFNASVNGTFQVLAINPIVVNNDYTLEAPIENKGRLTVTAGA